MNEESRPEAAPEVLADYPNSTNTSFKVHGPAVERLLDRLHGVKANGESRWMALCPAHDDRNPSLSVTAVPGRTLIYCHAGCEPYSIVTAVGLAMNDLFDNPQELTYRYDNGRVARRSYDTSGKKTFKQAHTENPPELYQLSKVREAVAKGVPILLCEGEEDVRVAAAYGFTATTAPQGAGNWSKVDYSPLKGAEVLVIVDNDEAGMKRGEGLVPHLQQIGVKSAVAFRAAHGSDLADHVAAGGNFGELIPVEFGQQTVATIAGYTPANYVDIASLISAGPVEPPVPTIGARTDNVGLFYEQSVSLVFADSESGKTMICLCVAADVMFTGGKVLFVDLDHNGAPSIVARLRAMGVSADVLADPSRFRFAEPQEPADVAKLINDVQVWQPTFVVIDSLGELLPMFGASSNSPDDFTRVHNDAIKPFATAGAGVALIDHTAKGAASAAYGSTGTAAKKRAVSGVSFRVHVTEAFTPGKGGKAELLIHKDRHGGLRAHSPVGEKEPIGAKFVMSDREGALTWSFYAPDMEERSTAGKPPQADVDAIAMLVPPPSSIDDARQRLQWNQNRTAAALREWREQGAVSVAKPLV